jgi:NAD(P)-dependent dehydrogenase (short-subunit alcohol dehydrogenase family)
MKEKGCAIISGSSRGIGLEIAKQLGLEGYAVVLTGRGEETSYDFSFFKTNSISYIYVQGEIESFKTQEELVGKAISSFGRIAILVNNAGVAPLQRTDLLEMQEESFDRVLNINTKAPLFLTQRVAKAMLSYKEEHTFEKTEKVGTIINVTSCSSTVVSLNRGEYCISKAAESMITSLFAARLAKENILVHEVRPGVILTDMTKGVKEKYDRLIAEGIFPMERWGTPEDVAMAVSLLCSEKMTYSTGNFLDVDGGFHIPRL